MIAQKTAPGIVQEHTVGLDAIGDAAAGWLVFSLHRHDALKEIETQQGGFAALPGKVDLWHMVVGSDVLPDKALEHLLGYRWRR